MLDVLRAAALFAAALATAGAVTAAEPLRARFFGWRPAASTGWLRCSGRLPQPTGSS